MYAVSRLVIHRHHPLSSWVKLGNYGSNSVRCASGWPAFQKKLQNELNDIENAGTYKKERVITSVQRSSISIQSSDTPVLNFCANNYLGLSNASELIVSAKNSLDTHGFGLSSVRFICGTQDIHKQLEKQIADFHKKEDTILYASCFDANAGLFETVLGADDAVISDELNHASIIDGIRLCKAKRFRYKHMNMKNLEDQLRAATDAGCPSKMIVTDGVFSMDGDVAPLEKICDLADRFEALVMIDECHATGFVGKHGRGTAEYCGVEDRIDIINSTLGKALGGATGGYTTGRREVIDLLRQRSRPYLFSNSLAPSLVGASQKVLEIITQDNSRLEQLKRNTKRFREAMDSLGFNIRPGDHPIVPVMLGDARVASGMADALLGQGIYVIGFSYPVVPKGKARIRVQLSAAHSDEDVTRAIDAFAQVGRQFNVIS